MTCICALQTGGKIWIGADSAVNSAESVTIIKDGKIFRRGGMLVSYCGSFRFRDIIAGADLPPVRKSQTVGDWIRGDYCASIRAEAAAAGFVLGVADNEDDSCAIVALDGAIYVLDIGARAYMPAANYAAIGSGAAWAEGSLFSSKGSPLTRIKTALAAAVNHSVAVRGPFQILTI